ncbi:hypothetical protein ZWY2020_059703 [Hordeum vulgare]|nr:hypothetical protein ZWY2020_059703 [Hordeum vulgare]
MAAAGMDMFVATMVFCEAPFDGTMAPVSHDDKPVDGATAAEVASALLEAAKDYFSSGPASEQQQQHQGRDSVSDFFDAVALE